MLWADVNEVFMISSAICVAIGWYFIRRRQIHIHRRFMLTAAALGACFFITYVIKTLAVGDATFGGPHHLVTFYQVFLQSHATLATVAGVLGVVTIRYALRSRFVSHRRVAPWTASLWLVSAASGLVVYMMLYVLYPTGPVVNVIRAITGN